MNKRLWEGKDMGRLKMADVICDNGDQKEANAMGYELPRGIGRPNPLELTCVGIPVRPGWTGIPTGNT